MIDDGEVWLRGAHIPPYLPASDQNHDPDRPRKLLLHRREIERLIGKTAERGLTLVPTRIYFKGPRAKVELALAKGKEGRDRRREIADRDTAPRGRAGLQAAPELSKASPDGRAKATARERISRARIEHARCLLQSRQRTITDFVKDHPAEAYGIAGAVILLLILLLLINRRRKKERDGGEEVSRREARQAKKQAKAEAKDAKAEAKAEAEGREGRGSEAGAKGRRPRKRRPMPKGEGRGSGGRSAARRGRDQGRGVSPATEARRKPSRKEPPRGSQGEAQADRGGEAPGRGDRTAGPGRRSASAVARSASSGRRSEPRRKAERKGEAPPEPAKDGRGRRPSARRAAR